MAQPGWYPDPADPRALRYWSGTEWTSQVQPPSQQPPPSPSTRGPLWLTLLGIGVVAVVVAVIVVWVGRGGVPTAEGPATRPTRSAWDDSGTATPTPAPAVTCADRVTSLGIGQINQDGRMRVGNLSMPVPSGWSGPIRDARLPFGRDGWAYSKRVTTETAFAWSSSVNIGYTAFAGDPSVTEMSQTIADCVTASAYYPNLTVKITRSSTTMVQISGFEAAQTDVLLSIDNPQLHTKGSMLRIVVTRTSGPSQYFFSAVPMESTDHQTVVDQTTLGLQAS